MHGVTWKFLLIEMHKEGQSNDHTWWPVCSHNPQCILLARLFALCDTGSHCSCFLGMVNSVRIPKCAPAQRTRQKWKTSPVPLLLHMGVWHRNLNNSHQAAREANGKSLILISKSPFLFSSGRTNLLVYFSRDILDKGDNVVPPFKSVNMEICNELETCKTNNYSLPNIMLSFK